MSRPVPLPSDRSFGFTFVVVFSLIALWAGLTGRTSVAAGCAMLAALTLAVALLRAALLRPLNRAWMKFGAVLHRIVNPIVLGAIYYLVIAPVGIGMRIAGRDALRRRFEPDARTYWIDRTPPGPAPDSLPKQF